MILYGITQCDSVKKARKFLTQHDIPHTFFDFKKEQVTPSHVQKWLQHTSLDALFNKRSKTFRELSDSEKQAETPESIIQLMCEYPTLIKRPVLDLDHDVWVGFKAEQYEGLVHAE